MAEANGNLAALFCFHNVLMELVTFKY